jgi:CHAD domain-containing protein
MSSPPTFAVPRRRRSRSCRSAAAPWIWSTRKAIEERVSRSSTTEAVVRRCIASSVLRLMRHDAWVRAAADPEAIHQARVATRRLRSDPRTFAPLLDAGWVTVLRGELRWIGAELGAVREAEVLMDGLCAVAARLPDVDRREADRLIADLVEQIATARQRLLGALCTPRYLDLLDRLVAAARKPLFSGATDADEAALVDEGRVTHGRRARASEVGLPRVDMIESLPCYLLV